MKDMTGADWILAALCVITLVLIGVAWSHACELGYC